MHEENEWKEAYERLNPEQKKAVDAIEGPVMVIAGPGTGKTQILTLRIANILQKTDTKPESILALTFTESGAAAMKERLFRYIGAPAYRVPIHTFHGFARQLIAEYPDAYTTIIGGRPAEEIEKIELIETILDGEGITHLRPHGDPSYYVKPILRAIGELKQENLTPDRFADRIVRQEEELAEIPMLHEKGAHKGKVRGEYKDKEKKILKNRELLFVYREYEALLREARLYDFDDMIIETIKALEANEDMLRDLQERYLYVLADEHQDVNGSQNRILELLSSYHEAPNIFVVGDEKQAIYRFQGASLENFLYFNESFGDTTSITLIDNYRSGQCVLDAAHSLINTGEGPAAALRVPLVSKKNESAEVVSYAFSHQAVEDDFVVSEVKKAALGGTPLSEIAIIVRTNREVSQFVALLRKAGLAVSGSTDGDILAHPIIASMISLMEAAALPHKEEALFSVLYGGYIAAPASDLVKVSSARSGMHPLRGIISNSAKLMELGVENVTAFLELDAALTEAAALQVTARPERVLEFLMKRSGLLDHVMKQEPIEGGQIVRRLYDEIGGLSLRKDTATLKDVLAHLEAAKKYGLGVTAPAITMRTHAVQVMTAHKSKGLEFEHVFVPHLYDGLWGGARSRTLFDLPLTKHIDSEEFDQLDDERRLLYVAMTRAKSKLQLSYGSENIEGKTLIPSRLLEEIESLARDEEAVTAFEASWSPAAILSQNAEKEVFDAELFRTHLRERGLSVTALNNYLESPWNYLYRNVLRIPEIPTPSLQFGTVVHEVLQRVTALHTRTGERVTDTELRTLIERALEKLPLSKEEFVRMHERAFGALVPYTHETLATLPEKTYEEFSVRVMLKTDIDGLAELPLVGKLDRIDLGEDGSFVRVVDYKTGKPKTRGQIEGAVKDGNGNYKRQLTFYALLLSLYEDGKYACRTGTLSFVEPDSKGIVHEETYIINDEEIEALKAEIVRVAAEIANGTFMNVPCDPRSSNYCDLAQSLTKNI